MSCPLTNDFVRAKYGRDFAHEYARLKSRLQEACASNPALAPMRDALSHDVFETRVFRDVVQWFETCHRQGRLPGEDDTRRQLLFQVGRELSRRGLGSLVNPLAKAWARKT